MTTTPAAILPQITDNIFILVAIKFAIAASLYLILVSIVAMFSIWLERKVSGHMQSRVGPMHTGGWHGWSQSLADGLKLIQKEDLIPAGADSFMFRLAPYMAFGPVFAALVALPFGPQLTFEAGFQNGIIYILAVLSVEVMSVILAGWGSNSKWAIYGAMREACQMVSYEVPLGISIICGVLVAGTLNLVELGYLQGGGVWDWYIFHNPFMLGAFMTYFVASLASCKRAPFDLPESESELVAGFHTEYSGLRFSFFFFAEYAGMFVVGIVLAFLFLGGWNSPFGGFTISDAHPNAGIDPIYFLFNYDPVAAGEHFRTGATAKAVGVEATAKAMGLSVVSLIAVNAYSMFWVLLKAFGLILSHMWLRWTLPRIRIDQVMYTCVKVLLPFSLVFLAGTAAWVAIVEQAQGPAGQLHWGHLLGDPPMPQMIGQVVCTLIGLTVFCFCVAVAVWAFCFSKGKHPVKTFFPDVMPVGNQVSFTAGLPRDEDTKPASA